MTPATLLAGLVMLAVGFALGDRLAWREGVRSMATALRDRATAAEWAAIEAIVRRPGDCEGGCTCGDCGPFLASVKDWTPIGEAR